MGNNGWPSRPGVPLNPEVSRKHYIGATLAEAMEWGWRAPSQEWWAPSGGFWKPERLKPARYQGPVVTCVADLTARLDALRAELTAQHAAEVEQLQTALKAATQALHWCAENACTAGMSWSGMNIVGDKKSIDYVREAVHYYGQLDALRAAWKDRTAADVAAAVEAAREACARLAIELTAAPGQKNAKSEWRAQIGQEIASAIRARGGSDEAI